VLLEGGPRCQPHIQQEAWVAHLDGARHTQAVARHDAHADALRRGGGDVLGLVILVSAGGTE
jgi:hypothetical protein